MSLTDLWSKQRQQIEGKHVSQVIAFAGDDGKLRDGSVASSEFRDFLTRVPSVLLQRYADQVLESPFDGSGFALQDIVNQVGRRLGFVVEDGRYRGVSGQIGYDGIWRFLEGHAVVVEVKTTDAYRIDLNTINDYRHSLIDEGRVSKDQSSILIVVGRQDTGDLEAQIRGSRLAWDIRLISVEALMRLVSLKEEVEDPQIIRRISAILVPREFTKLDEIVDIVFSTTEDVKTEEPEGERENTEVSSHNIIASSFLANCIASIEKYKNISLIKRSRAKYHAPDNSMALVCMVSKVYEKGGQTFFWFGFHRHQKDFLDCAQSGFVAFGCGTEKKTLLVPYPIFVKWLDVLNTTEKANDLYWHIQIFQEKDRLVIHPKEGLARIDVTEHQIPRGI